MSIKSIKEKTTSIEIDLTGEDGNVFSLIGIGSNLGKQLGWTPNEVKSWQKEMMSGDYEHAINTFDKEFGHLVTLYR